MPIYEYTCKSCQKKFEHMARSMAGKAAVACPACGSKRTERDFSVFAVGAQGGTRSSDSDLPPACQGCDGMGQCMMGDDE